MKKSIAIFASGSGSNAENIYQYFKDSDIVNVATLVCNNPNAGVIERFIDTDVEVILIEKKDLSDPEFIHRLNGVDLNRISRISTPCST
jgi:phosphoribosylglycinamide formyltransferase-1